MRTKELPVPQFLQNSTIVRLLPQATPALLQVLSSLAPGLAARLAERLFMTPPRFDAPEAELASLRSGHRFRVPFKSGHLAAWSWGDGPTVFLVHGWAGRGGQLSAFVKPLVDAGFSVVLFDAPGHGQSPGRRSSMIEFCEAVQAVVRRLGPAHAVIAHSLGAPATALAMKRGLDVPRLVFIGAPVSAANAARKFADRMGLPDTVLARMRRRIELSYLTRWEELEMSSLARGQTAQLLVVHDQDDKDVPVRCAETITDHWKGAQAVITEGLGHRKVLKSPEVVTRVVEFVRSGKLGSG